MKMCQQGRILVMQLMRLGGCTRVASYQPCPKHGALQSSTELHWGTFGSGLMDTSLTGISTVLSQHEAPGDSPWEALASYTSVAMLFFKNLHTDMAHLVSDYKDRGYFCQMFHLLRPFLLLHIHFSDWTVVIRLIIYIRTCFCHNTKANWTVIKASNTRRSLWSYFWKNFFLNFFLQDNKNPKQCYEQNK